MPGLGQFESHNIDIPYLCLFSPLLSLGVKTLQNMKVSHGNMLRCMSCILPSLFVSKSLDLLYDLLVKFIIV